MPVIAFAAAITFVAAFLFYWGEMRCFSARTFCYALEKRPDGKVGAVNLDKMEKVRG